MPSILGGGVILSFEFQCLVGNYLRMSGSSSSMDVKTWHLSSEVVSKPAHPGSSEAFLEEFIKWSTFCGCQDGGPFVGWAFERGP